LRPDPKVNVEREVVERSYRLAWLKAAVARLPPDHRAAVVLVEVNEMRVRDAAALLGVRETALAMRLTRARRRLRQWWEAEHRD
jgi:RNA polymerase sigma-70 factor (ECF subfamily)